MLDEESFQHLSSLRDEAGTLTCDCTVVCCAVGKRSLRIQIPQLPLLPLLSYRSYRSPTLGRGKDIQRAHVSGASAYRVAGLPSISMLSSDAR